MRKPACLGGSPIFENRLNIVSPKLPSLAQISTQLEEILLSGNLTNHSRYARAFESGLSNRLGVENALVVANATLAITLAMESLHLERTRVILPSFTYCATAHALRYAGLTPVFADINPETFTLDPQDVESRITDDTGAILAVHIYGHPCDIDELQRVADKHGIPLIFDAAHAIGSLYHGKPIGQFGKAEIFSFHATKVFPVGEGGCITTNDPAMSDYIRLARKFGDPGDENTLFAGTNAKMQEFNAILGLEALNFLDSHISNRRKYADYLFGRLGNIPGVTFQKILPDVFVNFQNFVILIDQNEFGIDRNTLFKALASENIMTRKYFYPPLHKHKAYASNSDDKLPITESVASRVLALPFYSIMEEAQLDKVCEAIELIHFFAGSIKESENNS